MIPRRNKVSSYVIKEVFSSKTKQLNSKFFKIIIPLEGNIVKSPNQEKKFSVIIPSKIIKKATQRNYFKRVVYRFVKENMTLFENKCYIFLAKKEIKEAKVSDIKVDLEEFLALK